MEDTIAFANQLESLDTTGVPITAHVVEMQNVFHADTPHTCFDRDLLLGNAPETHDGYIFVPQVVE
jgi:aspartyl-tRNA(Asn)/glutamyl-tRNA(Gln) amidotransferase subunit C